MVNWGWLGSIAGNCYRILVGIGVLLDVCPRGLITHAQIVVSVLAVVVEFTVGRVVAIRAATCACGCGPHS